MRYVSYAVLLVVLLAGAFMAGIWQGRESDSVSTAPVEQAEPMTGGMQAGHPASPGDQSALPGSVQISPEKQQLIGLRLATAEKKPGHHTIRILGRVAIDENRVFRLNATTELWVRKLHPPTTGSLVRKGEPLLAFYSPNFLSAAAAYLYALNTQDRQKASGSGEDQLGVTGFQVRQAIESLQNIGVSDEQIEQMRKTRQAGDLVDLRSPTDGFVLSRNATLGQWVGAGTELYRIVDLGHVWITADIFENEDRQLKPGAIVKVSLPHQNKTFEARVSKILPTFDPATRTLKVRLETDNPGYLLKPDMFVDVEIPVAYPPAVTVPADAVLDSGLKKTVFVDRGDGFFEPREVETGSRFGDRIQIVKGLAEGERYVASGNFLVDSESRMQLAASGVYGTLAKDPACGRDISVRKAEREGLKSVYEGRTWYFSSAECKERFDREPGRYAGRQPATASPAR